MADIKLEISKIPWTNELVNEVLNLETHIHTNDETLLRPAHIRFLVDVDIERSKVKSAIDLLRCTLDVQSKLLRDNAVYLEKENLIGMLLDSLYNAARSVDAKVLFEIQKILTLRSPVSLTISFSSRKAARIKKIFSDYFFMKSRNT